MVHTVRSFPPVKVSIIRSTVLPILGVLSPADAILDQQQNAILRNSVAAIEIRRLGYRALPTVTEEA